MVFPSRFKPAGNREACEEAVRGPYSCTAGGIGGFSDQLFSAAVPQINLFRMS